MIRSTPHPPEIPVTKATPFRVNLGNLSLFRVQPEIRVDDALALASEYLSCAAATAYEAADNSPLEFRPLARAVVHQIEAAKALVEASIAGLDNGAQGAPERAGPCC
ncbi:Protein of unknown function [Pseudomonas sp. NFACC02]|jgi:hypothetical protein|uniref:DUF6124 family protein n=1 Tax=Pseudomonas TaxID=286 RepID=UPI000781CD97|nr:MULTISPECIES: DUF3077 domain-containing protein [Pseudomonas]SEQ70210.1 Protein of unknown function [Pseudomonas sp. NFACC02]